MSNTTENREYNLPQQGDENWHIPLNVNFELIDQDVHEAFANIEELADTNAGGNGTSTNVVGFENRRTNVGELLNGSFHGTAYPDGGYGIVFEAEDLHIESVVVEPELDNADTDELIIELRQFEDGATNPTILDSVTHTLSPGPQRLTLDFEVPASGASNADDNDQYVLQRGDSDNLPLRRIHEDEGWSEARFGDHTYTNPPINFINGWLNSEQSGKDGPRPRWLFFFDWLVGQKEDRVVSPRSTDVHRIFMRSEDPADEFDDITARDLWIDTSD